jgi:hypothetical protein
MRTSPLVLSFPCEEALKFKTTAKTSIKAQAITTLDLQPNP